MRIQLSDHFTYGRLLRFVLPSIMMIICTSVYSIVDGFFVSNFVGKTPFAALNLVMPVLMGVGTLGFMAGTGGSAVVSRKLGEGQQSLACEYFSMLIAAFFVISCLISVAGFLWMPQIALLLGATEELLSDCVIYARIQFVSMPFFILQYAFQSFLIAAERPDLCLKINVFAGITNAVLDYVLIVVFPFGLAGASLATAIGQVVGGLLPVLFFLSRRSRVLRFVRPRFHLSVFLQVCANGSSEMVTNLSTSVVSVLYNYQLMQLAGENGIAAYGIIMYVNIIFMAIFLGYAIGAAPVISFHYGAGNHAELKNLYRKSLVLMLGSGGFLILFSELLTVPLISIFASYDAELFAMSVRGFRLYALAFLVMGFNVWGSSFFTALGNGIISAAISFFRTFLFQIAAILLLPLLVGVDGIWLAVVAAELLAAVVTAMFLYAKRKQYRYA